MPRRPPAPAGGADYLSRTDAAAHLGVSVDRITELIEAGELPALDVSRRPGVGRPRYRIRRDALRDLETKRAVVPDVKPVRRRKRSDAAVKQYV